MDFIFFAANAFIFVFGLCIGSFLNCVIYRLEREKSIKGRSFCPNCRHQLMWKDLIPVLSFLMLHGKCRYCSKQISIQYPLVEISTALIFLVIAINVIPGLTRNPEFAQLSWIPAFAGMTAYLAFLFYITSVLIVVFVYDLKHYLIPDKVLFPAIGVAFVYRVLEFRIWDLFGNWNLGFGISAPLFNYFYAALIGSGFFLVIFLVSKGAAMGFGDVKLAVLLGLLLGIPNIFAGLFLSFFFGAVIGLILMALKKKKLKSQVPFAPFLIAGTFVALFWGQAITNWYLNSFLPI